MEAVVKYKPINSATGKIGSSSLVKKQKKNKKISFTPTHASETSQKYYEFDDKEIISFDKVVQQNEEIDFKSAVRHSSPVKTNMALDLYKEYNDIANSLKKHKRKQSCFAFFPTKSKNKKLSLFSDNATNPVLKKKKSSVLKLPTNDETKNEDFQKMTNIQEIHNFHEYTKKCMEIVSKMKMPDVSTLTKQFVSLPFENDIAYGRKRLAIFDLDETLIHCELKDIQSAQKQIKIKISASIERTVGLNIRPNYKETIEKLKENYHVVMFTASLQKYADAIMDEIDPNRELFEYRMYRNNCTQIKVDNQIYYIKDLRVFKYISLDDIVIIDNSVLSFGFHLENGIPILPYYSGNDEIEMDNLLNLLEELSNKKSIPNTLGKVMELDQYLNKNEKQNESFIG